jgi:hypothetical protein
MDPILEEMQRVKNPHDMKESRYRDWVTYLCALVARKDDEIATLQARITEMQMRNVNLTLTGEGEPSQVEMTIKRGPGRPRKDASHVG